MQKFAAILVLEGPVFDEGTLDRLELETSVHRNSGLIIDQRDSRLTLLFTRTKQAVVCAIELQRLDKLTATEKNLPVLLRGAVAYGPVTVDGENVSGDAVEIAGNLASIMKVGDVLVSGGGREKIGSDLPIDYEPLRDDPATGYRVLVDDNEILSAIRHKNPVPPDWSWKVAVPMTVMLLIIGLSWIWFNMPG